MSNAALTWAFHLPITGAAKAVLLALADHLNDGTGECDPSRKRLALFAGVNERTVRRAIADLQALGLIKIIECPGKRTQHVLAMGTAAPAAEATPVPPRTPRPPSQFETPDTTPAHPGHCVPPTADIVSGTPDTTPAEPLEPLIEPLEKPLEGARETDADSLFPGVITVPAGGQDAKRNRRQARTQIDPSWRPDSAGVVFANARGIDDVAAEVQRFRDHHASKGNVMADWAAAWRTWCGNAERFSRERAGVGRRIAAEAQQPRAPTARDQLANYFAGTPAFPHRYETEDETKWPTIDHQQ